MTNSLTTIALKNLVISPRNVRVVSSSKEADKQLIASIKTQGLLQNLAVVPVADNEGQFEVVAGGRRFAALQHLLESGEIADDYEVPCLVKTDEEATAVSLAENLKEPMHPADEFQAYKLLAEQGYSEKAIAKMFGHSAAQVKKLLKLGSVAPELVDLYRAGKMDLDCIMAFTLNDDHERQLACWQEVSRGYVSAHDIRSFLLEDKLSAHDPIVRFVGLSEFKKKGGAVISDMFESETYIADVSALEHQAYSKLREYAKQVEQEGWKWVESSLEGHRAVGALRRLNEDLLDVPDELVQEIEACQKQIDAEEQRDHEDCTDEDDDRLAALYDQLDDLEEKQEQFRVFTPEQKAVAGVIVTFDFNGELLIIRGVVRKEDEKLLAQAAAENADDLPASVALAGFGEQGIESQALKDDLSAYYAQAFQAELIKQQALAYDVLVYQLAVSVLGGYSFWSRMLELSASARAFAGVGIEDTAAAQAIAEAEAQLNTAWLAIEEEPARFAAFQSLPKKDKQQLMAFCVARASRPTPRNDHSALPVVGEQMNFNLADHWKPTAANYFGRIKKDALLDIGAQVVGEEFRAQQAKAKKGELAAHLEQLPEMASWMPDYFKA